MKATKAAISNEKVVKKSVLNELRKLPEKRSVAQMLPFSRSTLYHKPSGSVGRPKLTDSMKEVIIEFYTRQENITEFPNKSRNRIEVRPLIVLNYTKKKLFVKFCDELQDFRPSLSTFWKYKPKHIKCKKAARLLQCVCDVCENVSLIISAIKFSMQRSNFPLPEIILNGDGNAVGFMTLCSSKQHQPDCLDGKCERCGTGQVKEILHGWATDNPSEIIRWLTWKVVDTVVGSKTVHRLTKVVCTSGRSELLSNLLEKLSTYGRHVYMAKTQSHSYQKCQESLKRNECRVVVDFAENYTCARQGEAQSAYYSRNQVTIFPMVITLSKEGSNTVIRDSIIVVSNDLKHDSSAVAAFMERFFFHVSSNYSEVDTIHIWSDGCAAQFKSKKPFRHLSVGFNTNYNLIWNFFGARHGKCSADGEAGVVKTFLSQEARLPSMLLDNSNQVYLHLNSSDLHIDTGSSRRHFYFCDTIEINNIREQFDKAEPRTIPGTRRIHQIINDSANIVKFRDLSCYCSSAPCHHLSNEWKSHKFTEVLGLRLF